MLRSVKKLQGYKIKTTDGEIGKAHEFYFDDKFWTVRYLVVDTGNWLPGRQVLISPFSLGKPNWTENTFPVNLSEEQVKNSPEIDTDMPVSRKMETELAEYYGWPVYWAGIGAKLPGGVPTEEQDEAKQAAEKAMESDVNPNLRRTREVIDYNIQAVDGEVGHVEDFILEDNSWIIRYLVIDTRVWLHWLPGGKKILIAPPWINRIDWAESKVYVDLNRDNIENSPEFDPMKPVNRDYEVLLYDYYGRPKYWL
ncbi:PRC-barrel domain containing protein [candidate division KSB1 bacterium]|nr:PRC-barrel domain containing protein [candidate division KSB1 bacterium]